MENAIVVQNLNKKYQDFEIKDVSFSVPKGSIVGFIGENGAGKTTTIKAILNLITMDQGAVEIMGMAMKTEEKRLKEELGVVLDGTNFHENLNPKEVELILKQIYKKWDSKIFNDYLNQFKIPKNKKIQEFSKGMKMKFQISMALSHDPKILILDEPTSGLDPVVREEILDVFMDFIQNEEHAIFISSHITSDLDKIADYIIFIHQGEIVLNEEKETLIDIMGVIKCGIEDFKSINEEDYIRFRKSQFGYEVLVKDKYQIKKKYPSMIMDQVTLEEIMLFYIKGEK